MTAKEYMNDAIIQEMNEEDLKHFAEGCEVAAEIEEEMDNQLLISEGLKEEK